MHPCFDELVAELWCGHMLVSASLHRRAHISMCLRVSRGVLDGARRCDVLFFAPVLYVHVLHAPDGSRWVPPCYRFLPDPACLPRCPVLYGCIRSPFLAGFLSASSGLGTAGRVRVRRLDRVPHGAAAQTLAIWRQRECERRRTAVVVWQLYTWNAFILLCCFRWLNCTSCEIVCFMQLINCFFLKISLSLEEFDAI